jgi:biotin carboxylase
MAGRRADAAAPAGAPRRRAAARPAAKRRLLLLLPTLSYRVADFMDAAHRLGVDVAVGSNRRQVLERHARGGTVTLNFRDAEKGVRQIVAYAERHPLAAVVGVDDETVLLAARASEALGLSHNSAASVAAARDKHVFRTLLRAAGLPSPRFAVFSTADDPLRAAGSVAYPAVLKPLALSASRGVIRADGPDAFVAAFRRVAAILRRPDADCGDLGDRILVESYVPGVEVALEGLLDRGRLRVLALFDKPDPLEGPYFEETIYLTPTHLSARVRKDVEATTARAVAALGLREGPVHAELRLNERGVWPIEVAARSIGGLCSRTLRFGTGHRLEDLILSHALGLPIPSTRRQRAAAGVMMIPIPKAGVLRAVHGVGAALAVPGIEDVRITIPVGAEVEPLPEGSRYLGFIFARDEHPAAAEAALREAHRRLAFDIELLPGSGAAMAKVLKG